MSTTTDITFIEMHDARVSSIETSNDRRVLIVFEYLPVYRREGEDSSRERLWSYEGEICVHGARSARSDVLLDVDNWVSDGHVLLADGTEVDFSGFLERAACAGFVLQFASGDEVKSDCDSIEVRLGRGAPTDELWIDGEAQRGTRRQP